jgi:hypothetical protein
MLNKTSQLPSYRDFEELLFDNALLKGQNQALVDKTLKWKEWWQTI